MQDDAVLLQAEVFLVGMGRGAEAHHHVALLREFVEDAIANLEAIRKDMG